MATVTIPNTFVTGTTILASEMNANFTAITAQVNGNLDANNLANSAVTENKIANLAVTEGKLAASAVATAKIANLAVTEAKLAASAVTNAKVAAAAAIDATKIADGSVSNTEFQYLNGVTSAIQTQLDAKEDNIALTANRVVASDAAGALVASAVTDTELGYLDGVTSAIQTQLDAKLETVTTADIGWGAVTAAKLDSQAVGADPEFAADDTTGISLPGNSLDKIPDGLWYVYSSNPSKTEVRVFINGTYRDIPASSAGVWFVIGDGATADIRNTDLITPLTYYLRRVYP